MHLKSLHGCSTDSLGFVGMSLPFLIMRRTPISGASCSPFLRVTNHRFSRYPNPSCSGVRYFKTTMMSTQATPTTSSPTPLSSPIAVIGGSGKMGTALITGIQSSENPPRIIATSRSRDALDHLTLSEENKTDDNALAVSQANMVLVSVKPNVAPEVFREIGSTLNKSPKQKPYPIIVSVVAGLSMTTMRSLLGIRNSSNRTIPIVRCMPNTPAAVNAGCTSICGDEYTPISALDAAENVLRCTGNVERISEKHMYAATAVAGSGVAYLFMAAEAMADAGVKHGLDRKTALRMAASTVNGAGALLMQGKHPAILRNEVESPGGVTIAATSTLEEEGFRSALGCAMDAAVERLQEMEEEAEEENDDEYE